MHFSAHDLAFLLTSYGYFAVLFFVMVESLGVPFPGETMLLFAAIYSGTRHGFLIGWIIVAAATGAITGDNVGFWIGREGGFWLLKRYGRYVGLNERKLKVGQYLFLKYGGKVVFFGRFVAILRTWSALLAGMNRMGWRRFLFANGAGGVVWATFYGLLGYFIGNEVQVVHGRLAIALGAAAGLGVIALIVFLRKNEARLETEALQALPGPLAPPKAA